MSGATEGFGGLIRRGPMASDVLGAHYTTVFNRAVRDGRLSRRARGLLVELLSHRDGYGISLAMLLRAGPEGKAALTTALRELERHAYLRRERARDKRGRMGQTLFFLTDMPDGLEITTAGAWASSDIPQQPAPPAPADSGRARRPEPEPGNQLGDGDGQSRRSQPQSGFPALDDPALGNQPHKKNNFKKTNKQNTNPFPPSAPDAQDGTGRTDATTVARGRQTLLSIARHHPELHAALATGTTLADQAPLVGRLLAGGVPREHIREALVGRPYPPPEKRTHSLAALVAARLRQLRLLAAAADCSHESRTGFRQPVGQPAAPTMRMNVRVPKPECPGQDGLCGRPVGAPDELCGPCALPARAATGAAH
ncbi:hypothetical protein OKJ48_13470 [Streptomyces kunmingensis]|uniref:Helix-turn-helix domain-containing protein n=1 Tax=Streptomyces kunmingensis TaxID=68225 RepID=A0ABU6C9V0_9ACTN|nr:hypothetical protein [Streptomyces kunmingensis]MEB3961249.1 hypothetical protein [Streptomyces kunmingensis]